MSQIDYTYFQKGPIAIPNLGTDGVKLANKNDLDTYITIYEEEYLRRLLGDDLYVAYIAGIAVVTPAARWTALRSQLLDSSNKISPIASYVWFMYKQDTQVVTTGSGDKKTANAGMEGSFNDKKAINVFNKLVADSGDIYDWLEDNAATYPEWEQEDFDFATINQWDI
jgi:hypothetical protein